MNKGYSRFGGKVLSITIALAMIMSGMVMTAGDVKAEEISDKKTALRRYFIR